MPTVTIITATVGRKELLECVRSVAEQTYADIEHWVVADGPARAALVRAQLQGSGLTPTVMELPHPTGHNNYLGHRIYAAVPFLTDSEWVIYLDEDNWLEKEHVAQLVSAAEINELEWAYSLRNIVSWNGEFICRDDCQSLGWWTAYDGGYYLVDTNCYLLKRSLAVKYAPIWHRRAYDPVVETPDRALCRLLLTEHPCAHTTGQYTVNYRLGGSRSEAKDRAFFAKGNERMARFYHTFPWTGMQVDGRSPTHPTLKWAEKSERCISAGV